MSKQPLLRFQSRGLFMALGVLALGSFGSARATPAADARATVDEFVALYLAELHGSFPDARGRKALRPLATPRLNGLLEAAARGIDCQQKETKGEEPPPAEGDLFVSLFEGATAVEQVSQLDVGASQAVFNVTWVYKDPLPGREHLDAVRWTDRVLLERVKGRWLIDDFTHDGQWEFATRGKVSASLESVAAFCSKPPK